MVKAWVAMGPVVSDERARPPPEPPSKAPNEDGQEAKIRRLTGRGFEGIMTALYLNASVRRRCGPWEDALRPSRRTWDVSFGSEQRSEIAVEKEQDIG